jgi:hypothetical protein
MSSDNTATERMVTKYRDLIADFVGGRVSAQNFESAYLQVFKTDKDQVPSRWPDPANWSNAHESR